MAKKKKSEAKEAPRIAWSSDPSTPLEKASFELTPSSQAEVSAFEPVPLLGDPSVELTPSPQPEVQAKTSPYTSLPIVIFIGPEHKQHYVLQDLLQNPDWVTSSGSESDSIELLDVDESTGHVLVHYLYTGTYKTLDDMETSSAKEMHTGFKRAVLVYIAAKAYKLHGLQQLAKQKAEHFGAGMSIFDIVEVIKNDFSKVLGGAIWFHDYLDEKMRIAFEEDYLGFAKNDFFDRIDDLYLSKLLAKCLVKFYNNKISHSLSTKRQQTVDISEGCSPGVSDLPIEEELIDESCIIIETTLQPETTKESEALQAEQNEKEETALAVAGVNAANDLSWADATQETNVDDDWGTFATVGKMKKKKKGKATDPAPLSAAPPVADPATTFDDIFLDDSDGAPKIDMSFDGDAAGQKSPSFFSGGLSGWTSGWGGTKNNFNSWRLDDPSKDQPAGNNNVRASADKKKKEKDANGFNFNFDAFNSPGAPAPPVEENPPADDGWCFSFGNKAKNGKKKGSAAILEESIPGPDPVPELEKKVEDDPWSFSFGGTKDKKKKKGGALIEETPQEPEPTPESEPEPPKVDDAWDWGTITTKKKKGKKGAIEEIVEEPKVEEPPPPPPEPAAPPLADDDWGSFATADKTKKKKKVKEEPPVEELPPPPPPPEPEPEPEPEPVVEVKEEPKPNPFAGLNKSQKKKLEKRMNKEEAKRVSEEAAKKAEEEVAAKVAEKKAEAEAARLAEEESVRLAEKEAKKAEEEKKKDDIWGDTSWGTITSKKKEKKGGREEPKIEEPPPPPLKPEPEPVIEPPPEPVPEDKPAEDGWSDWGATTTSKKKKKGKKAFAEEPKPELEPEPEPAPEPEKAEDNDRGFDSIWGGKKKKKKKKKKNTELDLIPEPELEPIIEDPGAVQEPDGIEEPKAEEEEEWGTPSWSKKKMSSGDTFIEKAEKAKREAKEAEKSSGWGSIWGSSKKKETPKQKREREAREKGREEKKRLEQEEKERREQEPKPETEHVENSVAVQEICPFRAEHLLGDRWKDCKQCRAILCQVVIQLARSDYLDEGGYETVDQMLK